MFLLDPADRALGSSPDIVSLVVPQQSPQSWKSVSRPRADGGQRVGGVHSIGRDGVFERRDQQRKGGRGLVSEVSERDQDRPSNSGSQAPALEDSDERGDVISNS